MPGIDLDKCFGKEIAYEFELTDEQKLKRNERLAEWFLANQAEIEKKPYLYGSAKLRIGAQIRLEDMENQYFIAAARLETIQQEAETIGNSNNIEESVSPNITEDSAGNNYSLNFRA